MTLCSLPLAASPIAAAGGSASSSGVGSLAPFVGIGTQGQYAFRGERFWATETSNRFRAKESDSEMLGTTDKDGYEHVWYECDFIDVLHGASILALFPVTEGSLTVVSQEIVSNGETAHLGRFLVSGVLNGERCKLVFAVRCSDGTYRKRTLMIRGREL